MKKLYQIPQKPVIAIVAAILCFAAAVFELIVTLDYIVQFGFDQLIITDLLYVGAAALSGLFISFWAQAQNHADGSLCFAYWSVVDRVF